ncbi:NAD(P)/FAD-dependent oxidoreductase [Alkalicoccus luteus]|uniref:FAD-binding oxidoreductase n=1 Tax=Alkalicoccus luteus TaxID=1237094 RepID=A0A969PPS6_9BACI|nr:FAD-binding oxidoreductase [Alkalicoccus luteus]NJP37320.1 FAD-binding oxidoreductase [Alkalicoccus luteus]
MANYIIIGGGILGASAAYHLSRIGCKVTLFDAGHKGRAADAAAGIIAPWVSQRRNKNWYAIARGGAVYYPELIDKLRDSGQKDPGYQKVGSLHLHDLDERLHHKYSHLQRRRENAPEMGQITLLNQTETRQYFPEAHERFSSVYVGGSARVNGAELREALLAAAVNEGLTIVHENASIQVDNGRPAVVAGTQKLHPDKLIVTAGAWTRPLLEQAGFESRSTVQKGQIVHMRIREENKCRPVVMPHGEYYLIHFGGGKVAFGASKEDITDFNTDVSVGSQAELLQALLHVAPGMKNAEITGIRTGLRPFTPGFLPVFGELKGASDVIVADGLGASGLTSGPYLGRELAHLAAERPMELDPADYPLEKAAADTILD